MSKIAPPNRPQQTREVTEALLREHGVTDPVALHGIRGYFRDSMGEPGVNDRGIYDDAIILISPDAYLTCNANTDPSRRRPGSGTGSKKGMARLSAGVWKFSKGKHGISRGNPYDALIQGDEIFTVIRDGVKSDYRETASGLGINLHRGGEGNTSSLGCQTIPPAQWPGFIAMVYQEMSRHGQRKIPYLLIER